jgi:hypothetical protein
MTRLERFEKETSLTVMFNDNDARFMVWRDNPDTDVCIIEFHGDDPIMVDEFFMDPLENSETWESVFWNFDFANAVNDRRITEIEYWAGK